MVLKYYDYLERYEKIKNKYLDWEEYTGDKNKTFYDVLNLDMASIPSDRREAETVIRNAYKDKKRTEEVNLAYSVLKNSRLREDYDWLLKHEKWVRMMHELDVEKADDVQINEVMEIADSVVNPEPSSL